MSNHYSLSQTGSPLTTYRVIDHSRDGEVALHPATSGGLSIRTWFATRTDTGAGRPRRWQDRYASAAAHAPSPRLTLERLIAAL